jgi:hypothetical protein
MQAIVVLSEARMAEWEDREKEKREERPRKHPKTHEREKAQAA